MAGPGNPVQLLASDVAPSGYEGMFSLLQFRFPLPPLRFQAWPGHQTQLLSRERRNSTIDSGAISIRLNAEAGAPSA